MNISYRNKLITMSDGEQYVVLSEASYKGKTYALANDVVNNNLGPNMTLFRVEDLNGEFNFIVERDMNIVNAILTKMA